MEACQGALPRRDQQVFGTTSETQAQKWEPLASVQWTVEQQKTDWSQLSGVSDGEPSRLTFSSPGPRGATEQPRAGNDLTKGFPEGHHAAGGRHWRARGWRQEGEHGTQAGAAREVTGHARIYLWAARMDRDWLIFTMTIMSRPPVSRKVGQKSEKRRLWGP